MKFFYTLYLLFVFIDSFAQVKDSANENRLDRIVVTAYEQKRQLKDVPASVSYINKQAIDRFSSQAIVHAVNTTAGVRMEERSPGSYRLNIRGSSIRSPFGVRNVKVYFNGIPFTDPGGHTYLNSLGFYNFNSIEIIKGPGSSLYGAGTGGVLLVESLAANERPNVFSEYTTGSYGLRNMFASVTMGSDNVASKIGFQHQQSDGYRYHSELRRNVVSWSGRFKVSEKDWLRTTFLYSDLFYETPGALTKAEFETNPKLARPGSFGFPGAIQSRASIHQKSFLAGANYTHHFNGAITNSVTAYGMFTELRNPTIRNYGKSEEPHVGARTTFSFTKQLLNGNFSMQSGAEIQQGFTSVTIYRNRNGEADSLQSLDEIPVGQSLLFLQASFEKKGWEILASGSVNFMAVKFKRSYPFPTAPQNREFNNELAPRVSIARKWKDLTVYASIARGFSPPTSAELLPSGSNINLTLSAESGVNHDIGVKGHFKNLVFDINAFLFSLQNTIVQRRDAGGGDYFINAGKTSQRGIETSLQYPLLNHIPNFRQSLFWLSHTWHYFKYKEFKQLNNDFSGKFLPGVPRHTISTGIDVEMKSGFLANINYFLGDRLPLNDANNEFAEAYHLLHGRLGFQKWVDSRWRIRVSVGAENLLDQKYSLGNDINGFGGRYYNAAAGRSFYAAITLQAIKRNNN